MFWRSGWTLLFYKWWFEKKKSSIFFVTLALFFNNKTLYELHQIFFFGADKWWKLTKRKNKKKEKNWWEVSILLFHSNVDQNCKFSLHNGSPNLVSTWELQKNNKNNEIILLILLSHCREAGTLILILCYGNWHQVHRDVPYVMSCGSPLLSIINVQMWVNENKKPKDPGKGCLHTFGRSLFRVVWPTFLSSTYPLIHPDLPTHPPKQSVWVRIGLCLEFRVRVKSSSTTVPAADIQH